MAMQMRAILRVVTPALCFAVLLRTAERIVTAGYETIHVR
jgi:hypothetical protein